MKLYTARAFKNNRFEDDPDCQYVNMIFYDTPLDDGTLRAFKDGSFRAYTVLLCVHDIPQYTDLSVCSKRHVTIDIGRWATVTEATEFLESWLKQVELFNPLSILAYWFVNHDSNQSIFFMHTRENGQRTLTHQLTPYARGQGRLEQADGQWRTRESYYFTRQ